MLLPFIDEDRLLKNMKSIEPKFNSVEKERNLRFGNEYLFIHNENPINQLVGKCYFNKIFMNYQNLFIKFKLNFGI